MNFLEYHRNESTKWINKMDQQNGSTKWIKINYFLLEEQLKAEQLII
jgi:hypothetical protein